MLKKYSIEENNILILISNMLNPDIQNKQKTEKIICDLAEKDFGKVVKICNKFIQNENQDSNVRYYSLILINSLINKDNGAKYNSLSVNEREEIRSNCLALLGNQSDLIRQYSCMLVSSLGQISKTINKNEWPDLIPLLCKGCKSSENKFKLSAIKTLNMIWEKFPNDRDIFTSEELILMEASLIQIMSFPGNSGIALESIKAYKTFMNYISNKFENLDYLGGSLKLILNFCKVSKIITIEVVKFGIHCITEITKIAYKNMDSFIEEIFKFFGQMCLGKNEELSIQSYIYFTEISFEEIERKKNDTKEDEKASYNKNYIQKYWNILFFCIKDNIKNYQNNKNNFDENGEYTRFKALFPLINNISKLLNENTFEEIYKYIFERMSEEDPLIINSAVFIFSATLETIHEYIIIGNISKIIPSLCKFLTISCPILNYTAGDCLEKICKRFGGLIIGDKSLFIKSIHLLAQLLLSKNLDKKPKINICLCFCNLCEYIKSSSLQHLGLISPYLNNLLFILDTLAYLPYSYEYNSNLSYYCFLTISKLFFVTTEKDKLNLQDYFQKFYQRLNEAKDISNFNNDKEKQYKFQEYLCLCLKSYCNEGNNNAKLEPDHIILFFKIIENYFEIRKEIFENGLLALMGLVTIFSNIKTNKNENEFINMINNGINYIKNSIISYKDMESLDAAFISLRKIIHASGNKIKKEVKEIIEIFEKIFLAKNQNIEILSNILLIFSDFLSKENNIIWNYIEIGFNLMEKLINVSLKEHQNFVISYFNYDNFKIYVNLNDYIIEFIEEVLQKISSEKKNLKDNFKKYIGIIMKYLNLIFGNQSFKPQDDFILSSINSLIYLTEMDKEKTMNLIQSNSLNNLYKFADDTKNSNIISTKILLQDHLNNLNNDSINEF